jgi:hypothetical protein
VRRDELTDPTSDTPTTCAEYRARLRAELTAERVPSRLRERVEECIRELEAAPGRPSAGITIENAVRLLDAVTFRK